MSLLFHLTFRNVLALSIAIRVGLIIYSEWHDAHSVVKYTDIDYRVFSDAARFLRSPSADNVAQGPLGSLLDLGDPYTRETYRYTPLLAFLLLPNEWLHPSFGKYLFAACDILNGIIMYRLLRTEVVSSATGKITDADAASSNEVLFSTEQAPTDASKGTTSASKERLATLYSATHLLNPMVFSISTRGSSEAVLSTLVLLTLYAALKRRWDVAAVLLGVSTHWKIYPFVYGIACLGVITSEIENDKHLAQRSSMTAGPFAYLAKLVNKRTLRFLAISAGTFVALGVGCYAIWGYPFLYESYLYHLHRLDHRHNFSPYFYLVYLSWHDNVANATPRLSLIRRALRSPLTSFVPQMVLTLGTGLLFGRCARDLPFAWFVQTVAFVLFNKVCTSQYFLWYLLLLPLIMPRLRMSPRKAVLTIAVWVLSQALWLWNGFRLEFLGENVFLALWMSSLVYVAGHGWVLGQMIDAYTGVGEVQNKPKVE